MMRPLMKICWVFLGIVLLWGCKSKEKKEQTVLGTAATQGEEIFKHKVTPKYAKNFTVTYHNSYKVVRTSATLGDWGGSSTEIEDIEDVMVLVQKGAIAPVLTGNLEGAVIVTIPANQSIATNSSGLEIWMDMLGLKEQLVAIGGSKTFDDSLRTKLTDAKIGEVGYSWAAPPDMEVLLERKPDIFLMVLSRIGFGESLSKLRRLGVPTVPVFDWAERDYMARSEWIKYCALFFDMEKEANEWFEKIEQEVDALKKLVGTTKSKPVCLWGHFVDSGFWLAHANNAEARLLRDAGGMLSSYEVVGLGRYPYTGWSGKLKPKDHEVVQWAIDKVGAHELTRRMLTELSDGERQKIMVAKALAQETEVMVLDEITAFLDLPRRIEVMQLMQQLAKKENKCILMSTHDMELALKYADKLWLLPKNGKLVIGAPEDLVLDGSFAKAFESEGIHFDMQKGAFETQEPYHKSVQLKGDGYGLLWTKKALERERIEVVDNASIIVSVSNTKNEVSWKVNANKQEKEMSSIYQLLQIIKEHE